MSAVLQVRDLHVEFATANGTVHAVNGASFHVDRGETLALLGESGCGKSVSAAAIMNIIESPPGRIRGGEIVFDGENLLRLSHRERRAVSGKRIAIVFQDALTALNPVYSVGWQIAEALRAHKRLPRAQAKTTAVTLLERVGIPSARERAASYPHELSGGQRQRVLIAMALAGDPDILIADEPTTALDVTVQAEIMDLLAELQRDTGMGMILITHDLGLVAEVADRVAVMYAGRVVETAPVGDLFNRPAHPYTLGLLGSVPRGRRRGGALSPIRGMPPDLASLPSGCAFYARCDFCADVCMKAVPVLEAVGAEHASACHRSRDVRS